MARYWWYPVTDAPNEVHPQAFADTYMVADEQAGGVVAYVGSAERAEAWVDLLNATDALRGVG